MNRTTQYENRRRGLWDLAAVLLPLAVLVGLLATYLLAPDFYVQYVLIVGNREEQVVEIATVAAALPASLLLFACAWSLWRRAATDGTGRAGGPLTRLLRHRRIAALFVAVVGLASFGLAGEEINWGQTWFGWDTPELYRVVGSQTNLHNAPGIGHIVRTLGNVFLFSCFVLLPMVWLWRAPLDLPGSWAPVIPEWPVTWCFMVSLLPRVLKIVYTELVAISQELREPRFYWDFVDQTNEQHEMLVALTFLVYALYRVARLRADGTR